MLWLRNIDWVSKLVPKFLLALGKRVEGNAKICLIRPGGLGDLVILSRVLLERGHNLNDFDWVVEKRNSIWLDYLGVNYSCYDNWMEFWQGVKGARSYQTVINTEQTYGLSTLFGARLLGKGGRFIGFSSNIRKDCYSEVVVYEKDSQEIDCFVDLFSAAGIDAGAHSASELTTSSSSDVDYSVVAIGGLQAPYKRLSIKWWQSFLQMANKETSGKLCIVGSPKDFEFAEQLQQCSDIADLEILLGRISFAKTVETIRGAKRLYGVDSGLIHVADFYRVPATVVFPGGNHLKWRPSHPSSMVLSDSLSPIN